MESIDPFTVSIKFSQQNYIHWRYKLNAENRFHSTSIGYFICYAICMHNIIRFDNIKPKTNNTTDTDKSGIRMNIFSYLIFTSFHLAGHIAWNFVYIDTRNDCVVHASLQRFVLIRVVQPVTTNNMQCR